MSRQEKAVTLTDVGMQLKIANRLAAAHLRSQLSQQELIELVASTGATHQEIGEVLGTTAATVKNALARTRKRATGRPRRQAQK